MSNENGEPRPIDVIVGPGRRRGMLAEGRRRSASRDGADVLDGDLHEVGREVVDGRLLPSARFHGPHQCISSLDERLRHRWLPCPFLTIADLIKPHAEYFFRGLVPPAEYLFESLELRDQSFRGVLRVRMYPPGPHANRQGHEAADDTNGVFRDDLMNYREHGYLLGGEIVVCFAENGNP